jgi:HlyD family secretion protein
MKTWLLAAIGLASVAAAAGIYVQMREGPPVEAALARYGEIRQFVDEQGQTRLPKTHLITMPYNGRIESIDLVEGTGVEAGQMVARVVPLDLELEVAEAKSAVDRLEASIRENDDTTVELTGLRQALNFVESMDRTVEAAQERVKAGQARLDFANKDLKRVRTLAETRARVEEDLNRAELAQVEAQVNYQQDLLVLSALKSMHAATGLMPTVVQQYIDRKQLARAVLEKEKAQAEARLRQAESNRERGVMTSPVDGVVLNRLESNERQVAGGTVLLEIGSLDDLEVEVDVLSQDVVSVKPGQPVDIYGPAVGPREAAGKVSRVYPAGFTKVSSLGVEQQRVKVLIDFEPNELARLRNQRGLGVGYRVRARIYTDQKSRALVIPRSALFRGPAGDWQVFAVEKGVARLRWLTIGLMNDELVEVIKGLDDNDVVILAPETNLTDGTRVSPVLP